MKKSIIWACVSTPLVLLLLLAHGKASAQYQLRCDAVNAVGDIMSAPNFNLLASGGQAHPTEAISSSNQIVLPGFIPCLLFSPITNRVVARAEVAPEVLAGSQFTAKIFVDMRANPAPDHLLGSFSSSLSWNPALLRFVSHSGILAGFTGVVNTANANTGTLEFNGSNPTGAGGDVKIIEITFQTIGMDNSNGVFDLNFSAMAAANSFANLLPKLTILDGTFRIRRSACQRCGDVSDDNAVNSTDALIVLSYDAGITLPPAILDKINAGCGDVNTDGATNSTDALIILSYDAGITVPFPVGRTGGCSGLIQETKVVERGSRVQ